MRRCLLLCLLACSPSTKDKLHLIDENGPTPAVEISVVDGPASVARNSMASLRMQVRRTNMIGRVTFTLLDGAGLTLQGAAEDGVDDVVITLTVSADAELGQRTVTVLGVLQTLTAQATYPVTVLEADALSGLTLSYAQTTGAFSTGEAIAELAPTLTNAVLPVTFEVAPPLPSGLTLDAGVLSGTPRVAQAQASYTITARDADGKTATFTIAITIGYGCDGVCLPQGVSGWSGPVTLNRDEIEPCAGNYATTIYPQRFTGFTAGTLECSCGCRVNCWPNYAGGASSCGNADTIYPMAGHDDCVSGVLFSTYFQFTGMAAGGCTTTNIRGNSNITFGDAYFLCDKSAAATGSCAVGHVCQPSAAKLCVYRDNDEAAVCPSGFGDRRVFYRTYADNRVCGGCSACSTNAQCTASTMTAYSGSACSGTSIDASSCFGGGGYTSYRLSGGSAGSCTAGSGGGASGTFGNAAPTVVCCSQ